MKKIATWLTAIVMCLATSLSINAQDQITLPKQFYGCTLGQTTNTKVKSALESQGLAPGDFGNSYYISNAKFEGIKFDLALFECTDHNLTDYVFTGITFLKSDLSKKEAIKFGKNVHAALDKKYTLIKKTVDGLDCYFTSIDGRTLTLLVGKNANDDLYQVSLVIELGTARLK